MIHFPLEALAALIGVLASIAVGVFGVWLFFRLLMLLFTGIGAVFTGFGRLVVHVFTCLKGIVVNTLRYVGSTLTSVVFLPMVIVSIVIGRWSAATYYGRVAGEELRDAALSLYRAAVGYPLRLIGLGGLVAGFERRIPEVIARAPGSDRPTGGVQSFDGYEVIGSLPPGGSGAKLYLATPSEAKLTQLARAGVRCPDKVVIKAFSLESGSTVPQMMREGRALEAARDLGLVLEHSTDDAGRFHYVMPFVPGEDLGQVTRGLHAASGTDGLNDTALRAAVGYGSGLLQILARFHRAGLWHKDIKPNNIIVSGERVELVDLGLVTPLASAMTLTTHGTEYYRDPELVRLAMQGVKVQDVDGVKFDLYSAGAVLYNLVENEFPAHGSLSKITRRCPDALRWIIRRSMADLRSRYASAEEMHGDLRALLAADDPYAVKPAQLPSMGGAPAPPFAEDDGDPVLAGLHPVPPTPGAPEPPHASAGPGELEFETRASRKRRKQQAKRRRKAPTGVLAFAGMTLAVLMIPVLLAALFVGVTRIEIQPSGFDYQSAPRPVRATVASVEGDALVRGFPGAFPKPPYTPSELANRSPSAPQAPAMPPSVREAMLGANLERVVEPRDWAESADRLVERAEDWVDELEDRPDSDAWLDELERWADDLDAWADRVDEWVDDIDSIEHLEPDAVARYLVDHHQLVEHHRDAVEWEAEFAAFEQGFEQAFGAGAVARSGARPTESVPAPAYPQPRVLAIAQRRHAIPRDVAEAQNELLTERLGWRIVSEDVSSGDPADDALVVRARTQAGFSAIDDPDVNDRLARLLLADGSFDAVLRWTLDEETERVHSHLILADEAWGWMYPVLDAAQSEVASLR